MTTGQPLSHRRLSWQHAVSRLRPRRHGGQPGGQVDRPAVQGANGTVTTLPPLAGDGQGPVPAFQAQPLDVRGGGFQDPQPVN